MVFFLCERLKTAFVGKGKRGERSDLNTLLNRKGSQVEISPPTHLIPYRSFNCNASEMNNDEATLHVLLNEPSVHFRQGYSLKMHFFHSPILFCNRLLTTKIGGGVSHPFAMPIIHEKKLDSTIN